MSSGRARRIIAVLIGIMLFATVPDAIAAPENSELVVNNSGSNGAITGTIVDSRAGGATITIENHNTYWTNLDVSTLGVALTPGPAFSGGIYAASGVLGPKATATWYAEYDPSKPAQVAIKASPYLFQTTTGGLAAALNILNIAASMVGGYPANLAISSPKVLADVSNLGKSLMGDDLANKFTEEALISGSIGRDIWTLLHDPAKRKVLAEALIPFGVNATEESLKNLLTFITLLKLLELTIDMGMDLTFGTSSGGVLFDSAGSATNRGGNQSLPNSNPSPPANNPPASPPANNPATNPPPNNSSANPPANNPPANPGTKELAQLRIYAIEARNVTRPGDDFLCGDEVLLIMGIENPNDQPLEADISAAVFLSNGQGEFYDQQRVSVPAARSAANWSFTLQADRSDTYPYVARIHSGGGLEGSDASTSIMAECPG